MKVVEVPSFSHHTSSSPVRGPSRRPAKGHAEHQPQRLYLVQEELGETPGVGHDEAVQDVRGRAGGGH